jgi:AcrR family transcriptional regulator
MEGADGPLTVRDLARDLGVTPMALYNHVAGKDDILIGVIDALLTQQGVPDASADWRDLLEWMASSLREMFHRYPETLGVYVRRPVESPFAEHRLETGMAVLVRAGFEPTDAYRAFASVHTYTIGYSVLEEGRRSAGQLPMSVDDIVVDRWAIRHFVDDTQYRHGLEALLRGLGPTRT